MLNIHSNTLVCFGLMKSILGTREARPQNTKKKPSASVCTTFPPMSFYHPVVGAFWYNNSRCYLILVHSLWRF